MTNGKYRTPIFLVVYLLLSCTLLSSSVHGQESSLLNGLDPIKANVNGDDVVNGLDYATCLFVYGKPDSVCDVVADGEVNSLDMTYILGSYGPVPGALNTNTDPISVLRSQSQGSTTDTSNIDELLRQVDLYDKQLQDLGISN